MNHAQPPIKPGPEGDTPVDLFHEVYEAFAASEHRRSSRIIEKALGCIDFPSITSVKLQEPIANAPPADTEQGTAAAVPIDIVLVERSTIGARNHHRGTMKQRMIEVQVHRGGSIQLEAHTPAVAAEWVKRLNDLTEYWKRRQRVE